jgi:hypothetical protein
MVRMRRRAGRRVQVLRVLYVDKEGEAEDSRGSCIGYSLVIWSRILLLEHGMEASRSC